MINAGRWVAVLAFAMDAARFSVTGLAVATGLVRPDLSRVPVPPPPGMESAILLAAGLLMLLLAAVPAVIAWGLYRWRNWARLVALFFYSLALLFLVVASFVVPLGVLPLVNGVVAIIVLFWLLTPGLSAAFRAGGAQP